MEWKGTNPFCLIIMGEAEPTLIDLDETGWIAKNRELMTASGHWVLARKAGSIPVLELTVNEGEEPYYVSRVVRPVGSMENCPVCGHRMEWDQIEHRAYGIGKKRLDLHVDRLWVLPNGVICGGDDVDRLGSEAVKAATNTMWRKHYGYHNQEDQGRRQGGRDGEGQGKAGRERRRESGQHGPGDRRSAVRVSKRARDGNGSVEQRAASRAMATARHARRREVSQGDEAVD